MGGMTWLALIIAFGVVAAWLLWEVLMQYKARLRWRLLAFVGFSLVVSGVLVVSSLVVISVGVILFAFGQYKVTMSYRLGFSTGWAIGGNPGTSRRRRDAEGDYHPNEMDGSYAPEGYAAPQATADPYSELGDYRPEEQQQPQEAAAQFASYAGEQSYANGYDSYAGAYDTGGHATTGTYAAAGAFDTGTQATTGSYDTGGYATTGSYDAGGYAATDTGGYATTASYDTGGYATTGSYDTGSHATTGSYDTAGQSAAGAGYGGQDQQIYPDTSGYSGEHQYAGYTDSYTGDQYAATPTYYDSGDNQSYDTQYAQYEQPYSQPQAGSYDAGYPAPPAYTAEGYAAPAEGAWVPQQREQEEPPYPPTGHPGYDQQQYGY